MSLKKTSWNLYFDNEIMTGYYGNEKKYMKFWFLRLGIEKAMQGNFALRGGITIPVLAETSTLGNILDSIPNPKFNAAAGIGYRIQRWKIDATIFFNPGKSYVEHKPIPGGSISLRYNY